MLSPGVPNVIRELPDLAAPPGLINCHGYFVTHPRMREAAQKKYLSTIGSSARLMRIGNGLLALVLGFFAIPALAADYSLELNPKTTKIRWTLGDALHTVHGTFNLKRGTIAFDTETGKASGQVVVDVASGVSGSEARDRRMHDIPAEPHRGTAAGGRKFEHQSPRDVHDSWSRARVDN